MARYKIIYLLLLTYYGYVTAEEAEDRLIALKPPEQSFFSRISNWFFPVKNSVPAEGRFSAPQYLPPNTHHQSQCNPCNQAPWIPIASNIGHKTYINFVPPSSHYRPQKINFIEDLRPPPVAYLKPLPQQNYGAPIGMQPPPLHGGTYHSLPPTLPSVNYYNQPPPPPPSDSYGAPIVGPNANYQIHHEYLPPIEQLPLASSFKQAIPIPNLSQAPLLPIHQAQNFRHSNVQVIPSVQVADFLASIEHPINVIQSPLVEVTVKNEEDNEELKLSENPIVVEDTHTAASAVNISFQDTNQNIPPNTPSTYRSENHDETLNINFIKQILQKEVTTNRSFTPPPLDYTQWQPTSAMVPPPSNPSTWLVPVSSSTTKSPKQIQIIVPYVTNKNVLRTKPYSTLLPVYSPPASTEDIWSKFVSDESTTQVYNIRDLLKESQGVDQHPEKLPYDVISLQNNINHWTQQEYAKQARFVPAKQIPDDFFTTQIYETSTAAPFDHEQAASHKKETKLEDDIASNFIFDESTTTEATTTVKNSWESASVTVSPFTKEKVYIVTPQPITSWSHPPQIQNVTNKAKFLVRVDPEDRESREKLKHSISPLTVVFSEWPHLINNLQTTTTTMKVPTSKHPLLGSMELSSYAPPPNSTVQTISGHSKVGTPASTMEQLKTRG